MDVLMLIRSIIFFLAGLIAIFYAKEILLMDLWLRKKMKWKLNYPYGKKGNKHGVKINITIGIVFLIVALVLFLVAILM